MILGRLSIEGAAVHSHRDSFLLEDLTVVSARRPFLAPAIVMTVGLGGMASRFGHLLYDEEIAVIIIACIFALIAGLKIGALKLLSRDLRGSELSQVIYGSYSHLQIWRSRIVMAVRDARAGDHP